jgi:hypothetical protein
MQDYVNDWEVVVITSTTINLDVVKVRDEPRLRLKGIVIRIPSSLIGRKRDAMTVFDIWRQHWRSPPQRFGLGE